MKLFQYSIVPPLISSNEDSYNEKIKKLIEELKLLTKKNTHLILGIYNLIDEPNRVTNEIIIQKKRLDPIIYLIKIKKHIENNNLFSELCIKYRIFRAIKDNETLSEYIDWVKDKANIYCDDFVIIGNFKNKILRTDDIVNELNKIKCINYGCFINPYRNNELERCKNRIENGCSFFINQIIVDSAFPLNISQFYDNIKKPIYFSITFINHHNIWNICKSLGVVTNFNYESKISNDPNIYNNNMLNLILLIEKHNQFINFEILSHNSEIRLKFINTFISLI